MHGFPRMTGPKSSSTSFAKTLARRKTWQPSPPKKVAEMKKLLQQIRDQGYSAPRLSK
jgi:DNA-binding IclR family transcriptional regulator